MKKSDLTNKDEYELNFPRYDIQRYDIQRYDIQRYNIQRYEIERYEKQIYRWYEIDKIRQIDIDHLDKQFKKKTSIVNKTDLIILAVATAIMAAKGVLYPIVSEKCGYSNIIGSTSNIIATIITKKPQSLDIGGLLVTISRMCMDARFIYILKKEYMQNNAENLIN